MQNVCTEVCYEIRNCASDPTTPIAVVVARDVHGLVGAVDNDDEPAMRRELAFWLDEHAGVFTYDVR